MILKQIIQQAVEEIRNTDAILIQTGAGMSVDSGLPDFRSRNGFWKAYPVLQAHNIPFYSISSPDAFFEMPRLAWAFCGHRMELYKNAIPHTGYNQLLEIGNAKKGKYFVYTSNIDGQFKKAGFDESRIDECHGSIQHLQCSRKCTDEIWSAGDLKIEIDENFNALDPLPICQKCGSVLRPNVLMHGDGFWLRYREGKQADRFFEWIHYLKNNNLKFVILEIGAGLEIPTVQNQSNFFSKFYNTKIIRINPVHNEVSDGHISIPLGAKDAIDEIYKLI